MKSVVSLYYLSVIIVIFSGCATAQDNLNIQPYTVQTSHEKLVKHYPFIQPVTEIISEKNTAQKNITYKAVGKSELQMDLYVPANQPNEVFPAVVLIHGGGWVSGSRHNHTVMAQALAEEGFVAATVSYRLSREAKYPAAVNDIKDAIRFLRNNASDYQINPEQIAVLGTSAGAQLATLVGVTPNSSIYQPSVSGSDEVQAIVNIDGVVSFIHPEAEEGEIAALWLGGRKAEKYKNWREASPLEHTTNQSPPILFINSSQPRFHAGRDDMVKKLSVFGIESEVRTILNSPHSFWLSHPWFGQTVDYTTNFLRNQLKNDPNPPYRKIVVAKDGSGEFSSIQEAINSTRDLGPGEVLIEIKNGIYQEKLEIPSWKHLITLKGEHKDSVIISNDDFSGKIDDETGEKLSTFNSYTVLVSGDDIRIENLTILNCSCGEGQAVALHVEGDRFVIQDANILGCQDTIYASKEGSRQYYLNCTIEGTTDFIFGEATAVFENCVIHSLRNSYITAAATPDNQEFGFVFKHCKLTADPEVTEVYLGRPWRPYAQTVFLNCDLGEHILPIGWNAWAGDEMFPDKEKTTFYAEYKNYGPGSNSDERVEWSHQLSNSEAEIYTLGNIFRQEDSWIPNK